MLLDKSRSIFLNAGVVHHCNHPLRNFYLFLNFDIETLA